MIENQNNVCDVTHDL